MVYSPFEFIIHTSGDGSASTDDDDATKISCRCLDKSEINERKLHLALGRLMRVKLVTWLGLANERHGATVKHVSHSNDGWL